MDTHGQCRQRNMLGTGVQGVFIFNSPQATTAITTKTKKVHTRKTTTTTLQLMKSQRKHFFLQMFAAFSLPRVSVVTRRLKHLFWYENFISLRNILHSDSEGLFCCCCYCYCCFFFCKFEIFYKKKTN